MILNNRVQRGHLVQRRSLHQLKWRGVNAYLLHINGFIQLLLVPNFNLNQPTRRHKGTRFLLAPPDGARVSLSAA